MTSTPPGPRAPSQPPLRLVRPASGREDQRAPQHVLLVVTGSVAAYKAAPLARALAKAGAEVRVVLTRSAVEFVGPATFSGLSGRPVESDMFGSHAGGELHVALAAWADAILVAPATADFLARLATGRADDLAAATLLCATCPVLVAPAMHPTMWSHPATQRSVATLRSDGRCRFVGPVDGEVASGDSGVGRMAEPEQILAELLPLVTPQDLAGLHVVVSAGPTVEDLDPVRFVSNRSSGKMGFALAERAARRGARVTLIAGPVDLPTPPSVLRVDVRSALSMQSALHEALGPELRSADVLIMAAAVGDYRADAEHPTKLKSHAPVLKLALHKNPDILADIGRARTGRRPLLIGFAVETDSDARVIELARAKLVAKRCDAIVANHARDSLGQDDNRVTVITNETTEPLPRADKGWVADRILSFVAARLGDKGK